MKLLIVALAFVAIVAAAPADYKEPTKIVRSEFNQQPEGGYVFGFESEDGSLRSETGEIKQVVDEENKPHNVVVVRGSYSYINSEGKLESVNYVADEFGYKAVGDSIPKVPARR